MRFLFLVLFLFNCGFNSEQKYLLKKFSVNSNYLADSLEDELIFMLNSTIKINKMNLVEFKNLDEIELTGNFKHSTLEERLKLFSSLKKYTILINSILEDNEEEFFLNSQSFKQVTGNKFKISKKISEYYFFNKKKELLKDVIQSSVPIFKDFVNLIDKDFNPEKGLLLLSFKNTCKKNRVLLETKFYESNLSKEKKEKLIEDYLFIKDSLNRNEKNLKKISEALRFFLIINENLAKSLENTEIKSLEDLNSIILELKELRKIYGTN